MVYRHAQMNSKVKKVCPKTTSVFLEKKTIPYLSNLLRNLKSNIFGLDALSF